MSTSAILPISSVDFGAASATSSQQSVFNSVLGQLQQAITSGNLTSSQTLLNALNALSPSSASSNTALGSFLTSVGTALHDGSATEAQSALSTYQSATASTSAASATATASTAATAKTVAAQLIQSQIQVSLINSLFGSSSTTGSSSTSSQSPTDVISSILNAAYGNSDSSGTSTAGTSSTSSTPSSSNSSSSASTDATTSPYDTLVASIQASLAAGNGTITPALAYLQASGNFVNTSV